MVTKWWVMLGIALLLAGQATGQPTQRGTPWAMVPDAIGFDENGTNGFIRPLDDVDGDGFSDVLVGTDTTWGLHVVAGPDLDRIIWSSQQASYWNDVVPDLDGDGVRDVWASGASRGTGSYDSVDQAGASATTSTSQYSTAETILSGATGAEVVTLDWANGRQSATGRLLQSAQGAFVYMSTTARADEGRVDMLVGSDQVWRLERQGVDAGVTSYNTVESLRSRAGTDVSAITRSDFADNDLFTIDFAKPHRMILAMGFSDITGDAVADLLLVDTPRPVNIDGEDTSVGADVWTAYDGSTGDVLWEHASEPAVRQAYFRDIYVELMGDLDGDGMGDLMINDFEYGPNAFVDASTIISGADGTELVARSEEAWYVPFGDVDGDGAAEFLTLGDWEEEGYSVTLANLEGPTWRIELDMFTEPVNWMDDAESPLSDVSGDGVPDLLMAAWPDWDEEGEGSESIHFFLVDGATGATSWRHDAGPLLSADASADVTGDGLVDLVYLIGIDKDGRRTSESTDHAMRIVAVRGTDASVSWSRTVMDPVLAGDRNVTRLEGWSTAAGDIDGDGADDLLIEMESACYWHMPMPAPDGSLIEPMECQEFHQFLILSGRTGGLLHMLPDLVQAEGRQGDPLPPVEQGGMPPAEAAQEIPAPAWMLAALALVALALRRRR